MDKLPQKNSVHADYGFFPREVSVSKEDILSDFSVFSLSSGGIGSWIGPETSTDIFDRLDEIAKNPLTAVQLNQLLALSHEAPLSDGFFRYYWLEEPLMHPYGVSDVRGFDSSWIGKQQIVSLEHLRWGLTRLWTDGLLYFGNVRAAYRALRNLTRAELEQFFSRRRFDTISLEARGAPLALKAISKDDRYMISEMACKSYGDDSKKKGDLYDAILSAYRATGRAATVRELLNSGLKGDQIERQREFEFSADEVLDDEIASEADIEKKFERIERRFFEARESALANTRYYLSMVNDLDVYVATSMRARADFRNMADFCEQIFSDPRLADLNIRYFDPTMSAAAGHEDKGLIECLMVKSAKVLVYYAGKSESYGKDAEAAMALSLGKPVIFYCDGVQRSRFYREVHPLSRLIEFSTGVAVGAIVTDKTDEVIEMLYRLFRNRMVYELEKTRTSFLRLRETLTGSVVRLQTDDRMLSETFWNHYHGSSV